jgi:putative transposase
VRARGNAGIFLGQSDYQSFAEPTEARLLSTSPFLSFLGEGRVQTESCEVMRRITVTHTQRWYAHRHSSGTGPVYQGRFKSFPVQIDEHFLTVARYVERNALVAKLVERAEEWQWYSVYRSARHDAKLADFLSPWPMERPQNWIEWINEPDKASELDDLRSSAQRGRPFGSEDWMINIAKKLGLEATMHSRGRAKRK